MIRAALILLFLAGALPAPAETVRVLSGEHPGFTRLAFIFEKPTEWRFGRVDPVGERAGDRTGRNATYELWLARGDVDLDISDVFRRVPRTRLADLSIPADGRLRLSVASGHRAVPFDLRAGVVVIDIRTGPPPEGSPFESRLPTSPMAASRMTPEGTAAGGEANNPSQPRVPPGDANASFWSDFLWQRQQATIVSKQAMPPEGPAENIPAPARGDRDPRRITSDGAPPSFAVGPTTYPTAAGPQTVPLPGSSLSGLIGPEPLPADQKPAQPKSTPRQAPTDAPLTDIASAQDLILRQLSRAAAQGLVRATNPAVTRSPGSTDDPGSTEDSAVTAPPADGAPQARPDAQSAPQIAPSAPQINVTAQTSMDRDAFARVRRALSGRETACPDAGAFDVAAWGRDMDPARLIAEGRLALLGEFDRVRADGVAELARRYLSLGFGAEAAAVIRTFPGEFPERGRLLALAAVTDGDAAKGGASLLDLARCDSGAALWSLMAHEPGDAVPDLNVAAVRRSFSDLPGHLREHLGYGLAERLIALGETDAAASIRNALWRLTPSEAGLVDLIDVSLSLQTDGSGQDTLAQSEERLLTAIGNNGPQMIPALLMYLEGRLARGLPVTPALAQQAAALAFEHRNAPDGPALMRAEVLARAATGDFAMAFAAVGRMQARVGTRKGPMQQTVQSAMGPLLDLLAGKASDIVFLEQALALERNNLDLSGVPPQALARVSERLLTLGFPAEARTIRQAGGASDTDMKLFLARTALAMGDAQQALRDVAGLEGAAADRLRASALAEIGNTDTAVTTFDRIGDQDAAARTAWLSRDWAAYQHLRPDARSAALRRLGVATDIREDDGALTLGADAATRPAPPPASGGQPELDPGVPTTPAQTTLSPAARSPGTSDRPSRPEIATDGAPGAENPVTPESSGPEGILARSRALVDQSRDIRAALADLRAALATPLAGTPEIRR